MSTRVCIFNPVSTLIDIILGADSTTGNVADAGRPVVLNSQGLLDQTLTSQQIKATAGATLTSGMLVNLVYDNVGNVVQANPASAASGNILPAYGFVTSSATVGQTITVYLTGLLTVSLAGFTTADIGKIVYLSATTPGAFTTTSPVPPNEIQSVGFVYGISGGSVQIQFLTTLVISTYPFIYTNPSADQTIQSHNLLPGSDQTQSLGSPTLHWNAALGTVDFANLTADPVSPITGEFWYRSNSIQFSFYDGTTVRRLYSTADFDSTKIVFWNQANTYTAGMKQTFGANATNAGLRFAGVTADPSTPATGDVWYRSDTLKLSFYDGSVRHIYSTADFDSTHVVLNNQANTYTAGSKQTFASSTTTAGMAFSGVTADPSVNASGDLWYRSDLTKFSFYDGTTIRRFYSTFDFDSTKLVLNNQANTYTAGSKQTVASSATTAGFAFAGVTSDPSSPANGDLWYRSDFGVLTLRDSSGSRRVSTLNYTAISGATSTYSTTIADRIVAVQNSATIAVTITLVDATTLPAGTIVTIKDEATASAHNITINTSASQTIDGVASKTISADKGSLRIYTNGANWFVI